MARSDLTEGPVWRALARVSAPMSLGILAVLSIGLADAYFLGQLGGAPLAAVGFIYPVTTALASLAIGLSAGANAAVSQALGREDEDSAVARMSLHAAGLGLLLSVLVALAFYALHGQIFSLMGARGKVMAEISAYVPLWALSFPFLVLMMLVNALFRAHGNAVHASLFMILAAAVNIALNPLFIFGWGPVPAMETGGAALATLAGRLAAAAGAIAFAVHAGYLQLCGRIWQDLWRSLREITQVGAPAAFSNAINPAGMALVTAAVATLGDAAVAGFGAATRVQSLAIVVLLALSAGIGPVVGQNWGAGKETRAQSAVVQAWAFCLVYGLALGAVLSLCGGWIAAAIAEDAEAADYTRRYLQVVGWSLFGYGILVTANAAMNARSKALHSMGLSLGRITLIYVPLAWLGVWTFGYGGILAAAVAANLGAVAGAVWAARRTGLWPQSTRITRHIAA
ncbi:MATE family efflux transporter (plasmid) [Leisingera aquaemixtae]|uniref:MATE family efflux transporter n=1 Tax=Leisingera aquaemixtae TaxID=1396826 RepID=UPI0021A508F9|nr:MATE family efflux transporter [Leisingera aquaemixtae]UWQ26805.1 MATE family efflux transporter [Leisingera aquaemixtae]UWQ47779.1 MATE family efflux transporter [Leisingera aquaemixtae]